MSGPNNARQFTLYLGGNESGLEEEVWIRVRRSLRNPVEKGMEGDVFAIRTDRGLNTGELVDPDVLNDFEHLS